MKITKEMLRTDAPPIIRDKDGAVNSVLALHSESIYCPTNTYIPRWTVANTVYYNLHRDQYLGWVELEGLPTPKFLLDGKILL